MEAGIKFTIPHCIRVAKQDAISQGRLSRMGAIKLPVGDYNNPQVDYSVGYCCVYEPWAEQNITFYNLADYNWRGCRKVPLVLCAHNTVISAALGSLLSSSGERSVYRDKAYLVYCTLLDRNTGRARYVVSRHLRRS